MVPKLVHFGKKMPWLQKEDPIVQQDGATPPLGMIPSKLKSAGRKGGYSIKVVTQPA